MKAPFILVVIAVIAFAGGLGWKMEGGRLETMATRDPAALSRQEEYRAASLSATNLPAVEALKGVLDQWAAKLAAASTKEALRALADELRALEKEPDKFRLLQLLCARWAEIDPEDALAYLAKPTDENQHGHNSLRTWVLKEWALHDVEAAWAAVSRETDEVKRRAEAESIGNSLFSEGAGVFWAWFQKARVPLPSPQSSPHPTWLALARAHPGEMEAIARELAASPASSEKGSRPPSIQGLFIALAVAGAENDPARALEMVRTSYPEDVCNICLLHVIPLLASLDIEEATKALNGIKKVQIGHNMYAGAWKGDAIKSIVAQIARDDPAKAIQWVARDDVEGLSSSALEPIISVVKQALADKKWTPQEAFAMIREQRNGGDDMLRRNTLEQMWAGLPPAQLAETAEWLKNVDSANARKWALSGVVTEWAKMDKGSALAFASRLEDASLAREVFVGLLVESSIQDSYFPGMLRNLVDAIPPGMAAGSISEHMRSFYHEGMFGGFRGGSVGFEGPSFAEALARAPAAAERDEAAQRVFRTWGALDPDAAMAWVAGMDDPALRSTSLAGAMEGWVKYDAWAASQWLAEQPRGADRDLAAHQLVRSLRETEPDSAWAWAADIGDATTRLEARTAVLRQWREADPAAAREAVASLPHLPPTERQKLTATLAGQDN